MLTIPIDSETERHLEALGARDPASKTRLARQRLLEALREEQEDRDWARLAEQRLKQPEKTSSLSEVAQKLGLES